MTLHHGSIVQGEGKNSDAITVFLEDDLGNCIDFTNIINSYTEEKFLELAKTYESRGFTPKGNSN